MKNKMLVEFSAERKHLGSLHPGDIFYYKRSLWITLNRAEGGRLIRIVGPGSQRSEICPTKTKVTYLYSGKKSR